MTAFNVGDVVSVEFPFCDLQTHERRPGLVLASGEVKRIADSRPRRVLNDFRKCMRRTRQMRELTGGRFEYSLPAVTRFQKIISAFLLVAWLPITLHCSLESVPGLEFLRCASDTPNQSDCSGDGCCAVEKSEYKTEQSRLTPPSPDLLQLPFVPVCSAVAASPAEVSVGILSAAPPELVKSWQFVFRTASPPRAPSFAS